MSNNQKLTREEIKKQILSGKPLIDDETAFLRHLVNKYKDKKRSKRVLN